MIRCGLYSVSNRKAFHYKLGRNIDFRNDCHSVTLESRLVLPLHRRRGLSSGGVCLDDRVPLWTWWRFWPLSPACLPNAWGTKTGSVGVFLPELPPWPLVSLAFMEMQLKWNHDCGSPGALRCLPALWCGSPQKVSWAKSLLQLLCSPALCTGTHLQRFLYGLCRKKWAESMCPYICL